MNQVLTLVKRTSTVKEYADRFREGKFDDLAKKHGNKSKKESEYGKCFSLDLPANVSIMSNDLLRSGLFSSAKRVEPSDETFVNNVAIATYKTNQLLLSGYKLDQVDYQVYEALVKLYKSGGIELEMKLVELVRVVGWSKGGNQIESLITSLKKLNSARIQIDTAEYQYFGGLVDRAVFDKTTGIVNIKLGEEIAKMYSSDNWTMLQVSDRSRLGKNLLARWLYNFMMTHKNPYPLTIELLQKLSGNSAIQKRDFKNKLKNACILINEKLGWECNIDKNTLYVKRKGLDSEEESV